MEECDPTANTRRLLPNTDRRPPDESPSTPGRTGLQPTSLANEEHERRQLQAVIEWCKAAGRRRPVNRRRPARLSLSDARTPTSPTASFQLRFHPLHRRQLSDCQVNQPCSKTRPIKERLRLRKIFAADLGKSAQHSVAAMLTRKSKDRAHLPSRSPPDYRASSEPRYSASPCAEVLVRSLCP
jgi:hypothetical protein